MLCISNLNFITGKFDMKLAKMVKTRVKDFIFKNTVNIFPYLKTLKFN